MNLRITPNVNTQNNRQNPSFGMVKCGEDVNKVLFETLRRTAGTSLAKAGDVFRKFMSPDEIAELAKYQDVFIKGGDIALIARDKNPFEKARELAENASVITIEDVKEVVSRFGITAARKELASKEKQAAHDLGIGDELSDRMFGFDHATPFGF